MMRAMRTWKSDGSINVMRLDTAAENLRRTAKDIVTRKQDRSTVMARLLRGEEIETPLAVFSTSEGNFK